MGSLGWQHLAVQRLRLLKSGLGPFFIPTPTSLSLPLSTCLCLGERVQDLLLEILVWVTGSWPKHILMMARNMWQEGGRLSFSLNENTESSSWSHGEFFPLIRSAGSSPQRDREFVWCSSRIRRKKKTKNDRPNSCSSKIIIIFQLGKEETGCGRKTFTGVWHVKTWMMD